MYEGRSERGRREPGLRIVRHAKTGQAVRQFIKEDLLPQMRARLQNPQYKFSFHDLRATFGLNVVDYMTANKVPYARALDQLRQLMWHTRLSTTESYLKYREIRALFDEVQDGWNQHLKSLVTRIL